MRRLALACLALLAAACSGGGARTAVAQPAGCVPANDTLVVPGCRIGPVSLGMSLAELYQAMGKPDETQVYKDQSTAYRYRSAGLSVFSSQSIQRVLGVETDSPRYALANGLRSGVPLLELSAKMGKHAWYRRNNPAYDYYCYPPSTLFSVSGSQHRTLEAGTVDYIGVGRCDP